MPLDALARRECQLRRVLAPRPAGRQIRDDRGEAVLRDMLVKHDEIIEHAHHRDADRDRRFLVDRHRCRAGEIGHFQDAARRLSECRRDPDQTGEQPAIRDPSAQSQHKLRLPFPVAPLRLAALQPVFKRQRHLVYLSSQTSSMRAPLKMLLTMTVNPFTCGCQQVARRS
jgi:hypothetical protein